MTTEEAIFNKARGGKVFLDTNLLLLFLIGTFERDLITRFKRTAQFSLSDFDTLVTLTGAFRKIVTTPHLLTEVSSLANSLPSNLKSDWHQHFARQTLHLFEVFSASETLMKYPAFFTFGLADSAVFAAASDTLVLTEDYRLAGFLRANGHAAMSMHDLHRLTSS